MIRTSHSATTHVIFLTRYVLVVDKIYLQFVCCLLVLMMIHYLLVNCVGNTV